MWHIDTPDLDTFWKEDDEEWYDIQSQKVVLDTHAVDSSSTSTDASCK